MEDNEKIKLILKKLNIQYSEVARNIGYTAGFINRILREPEYKISVNMKDSFIKKYNVRREFIYDGILPVFTFEFTAVLDGIEFYTKRIKSEYNQQDHKTLCELRIKRKSDTGQTVGLARTLSK